MSKKGFCDDIEELTEENDLYRKVLYTGKNLQLVLMAIQPGDEIGEEVHDTHDQFFRFEQGTGKLLIDETVYEVKADFGAVVPAGAKHNVINTGDVPLKLYTLYGPPEHVDGAVVDVKANEKEEHFDGKTTE